MLIGFFRKILLGAHVFLDQHYVINDYTNPIDI